ncbi:MAG: type II toxin-antitoxin system RelE/ParE family toxin [Thiovulaceae bacterium]|jgi:plasmid stabilization system protein ParE|nr:type II toxin-antitoxin system RelE/ParE family toxin [Sulfurimonadaceae bacterium]MDD3816853.1 type II toxin-antitoxin system RelE/ParE family toxin [Sulfurimonadaceae bacterium]
MTLEKSPRFDSELEAIVDFIAKDSPNRALHFFDEIISKINQIPSNPYIHKKRKFLDDENIREMIFKGYTIPFLIDTKNGKIVVLGIFNQNLWE